MGSLMATIRPGARACTETAYSTEFSAEYGESTDDGQPGITGLADRRCAPVFAGNRLAIAYMHDEVESPLLQQRSQGIVVEITLSQKIVRTNWKLRFY